MLTLDYQSCRLISDSLTICLNKPVKRSQIYQALQTLQDTQSQIAISRELKNVSSFDSNFDSNFAINYPLKILLAEDNIINQKVAVLYLKRLGYEVDIVTNGIEVLDSIKQQSYDVVLMDINMPEMDGISATKRIVAEFIQKPWIIAVTANALNGDRDICLQAGMQDYISKPINVQNLTQALEKAYKALR